MTERFHRFGDDRMIQGVLERVTRFVPSNQFHSI